MGFTDIFFERANRFSDQPRKLSMLGNFAIAATFFGVMGTAIGVIDKIGEPKLDKWGDPIVKIERPKELTVIQKMKQNEESYRQGAIAYARYLEQTQERTPQP